MANSVRDSPWETAFMSWDIQDEKKMRKVAAIC